MYTKYFSFIIGVAILPSVAFAQVSTGSSNNSSPAALQAQVQNLLQQVTQLQSQLGAQTAATTVNQSPTQPITNQGENPCPLIGRNLSPGMSGADVTRLQQYLALDPSVYPNPTVSGYFGTLTQRAVERWQIKFNLVSYGTPRTTGYGMVGPRTAAAISLQCSLNVKTTDISSVGGFIKVTPISGSAPLNVSVQATINTSNNCNATTYYLDFGDGSATVPLVTNGSCVPLMQTLNHVYNFAGTYQVALSAGSHRTTATVTVTGNTQSPQQPVTVVPTPAPVATTTPPVVQATSTYSIVSVSPSGTSTRTLTVVISTPVCNAYALSWGDGAAIGYSGSDPPVGGFSPGACTGQRTSTLTHTYNTVGSYTVTLADQVGTNGTVKSTVQYTVQ